MVYESPCSVMLGTGACSAFIFSGLSTNPVLFSVCAVSAANAYGGVVRLAVGPTINTSAKVEDLDDAWKGRPRGRRSHGRMYLFMWILLYVMSYGCLQICKAAERETIRQSVSK